MGWFSGIGHALNKIVQPIDKLAESLDPLTSFNSKLTSSTLGKIPGIGSKLDDIQGKLAAHPIEGALGASTIYMLASGAAELGDIGGVAAEGAGSTGAGAGASSSSWWSTIGKNLGANLVSKGVGGMDSSSGTSSSGSGTNWSSIIGGLGSLYSGITANNQASSLQTILNNAYGFNNSRPLYTAELNALMANPEQAVEASPGYQAQMNAALQATQRTGASQGLTGSGTEAAAIANTGASIEQSTYNNLFNQLSSLSGANLNPSQLFSEQMSQQQTSQNASGGIFSGLGSLVGGLFGGSSGGSGGLFSGLSNLFGSSGGPAAADSGSINLFADAIGG